jgi:hypothetical protein
MMPVFPEGNAGHVPSLYIPAVFLSYDVRDQHERVVDQYKDIQRDDRGVERHGRSPDLYLRNDGNENNEKERSGFDCKVQERM